MSKVAEFLVQIGSVAALAPGRAGLEEFVRQYLSPEHRDNPDPGCPSALLDEIGRCADMIKRAYTDGAEAIIDELAMHLAPGDPAVGTRDDSLYAIMIGTLQLSRALADRQLSDEVLEQGIQNTLALIRARRTSRRTRGMRRAHRPSSSGA